MQLTIVTDINNNSPRLIMLFTNYAYFLFWNVHFSFAWILYLLYHISSKLEMAVLIVVFKCYVSCFAPETLTT